MVFSPDVNRTWPHMSHTRGHIFNWTQARTDKPHLGPWYTVFKWIGLWGQVCSDLDPVPWCENQLRQQFQASVLNHTSAQASVHHVLISSPLGAALRGSSHQQQRSSGCAGSRWWEATTPTHYNYSPTPPTETDWVRGTEAERKRYRENDREDIILKAAKSLLQH